ncbi:MAG: hydroxymethylbilane synthase [Pirellulales bacterium]
MSRPRLRLGTRASALARWQAQWVADSLKAIGVDVELVPITTRGDTSQGDAIGNLGAPGVFTKELQRVLIDERIDLAVHSLKDLPTDVVDGLTLAAVPPRESPFDVLLSRHGPFEQLPQGATVGTGSLRRRAQLLHARADLQMRDIRGNVDTRVAKLAAGEFDAIVLAEAGLRRLELEHHVTQRFEPTVVLPAVGQGALGIEVRTGDSSTHELVERLDDPLSHSAVLAERTLLAALRGGCLAPIGAWARVAADGRLRLDAAVLSADGKTRLAAGGEDALAAAVALGNRVAANLLVAGAGPLIDASRRA